MAPHSRWFFLSCLMTGVLQATCQAPDTNEPTEPPDPRCQAGGDNCADYPFLLKMRSVEVTGMYSAEMECDEEGSIQGVFNHAQLLTPDLPVCVMLFLTEGDQLVASICDTMQAVFDKNPGILPNMNCCLEGRKIRFPAKVEEEKYKMAPCHIWECNIPKNFEFPMSMYLLLNQTTPDPERLGSIRVEFELEGK